jgi:hypothetical protein
MPRTRYEQSHRIAGGARQSLGPCLFLFLLRAYVSAQMSKPLTLFTPLLPRELWHEIFQLATFIHGELDIPSAMIRPDLFAVWDGLQPLAWKKILPCRLAIQGVSRSWHSIGMELLYRSFHHTEPAKVRLFARTLCAQPLYRLLVKRLTTRYTREAMSACNVSGRGELEREE